jgi:hypothetical protein
MNATFTDRELAARVSLFMRPCDSAPWQFELGIRVLRELLEEAERRAEASSREAKLCGGCRWW